MHKWAVYILECKDSSLYTGITNNLEERIKAHEEGRGAKYTKGRGPFLLKYKDICKDRSSASKREIEIKKLSRERKIDLFNI